MFKSYVYSVREVIYSVVIPVHNQENIFCENLQSILKHTLGNFEILIVLDYCYDKTEQRLLEFLDKYVPPEHLIQLKLFKTDRPLFETKCDNIGFRNSVGKFCLEIQADMEMTEPGYNIHLTKPFAIHNVIAVSGRCAHNLFDGESVGRIDIEKPLHLLNVDKHSFYVMDTCNRGPLLIDRAKLIEMNYLNEEDYFLDNSDHDLMARSFLEKNYICGYIPIDFNAPLCNGSTRKHKVDCIEYEVNQSEKKRLELLCKSKPGLNQYRRQWKPRKKNVYRL
jgi:glycosyltransferase involved in cell wall biosynthesis